MSLLFETVLFLDLLFMIPFSLTEVKDLLILLSLEVALEGDIIVLLGDRRDFPGEVLLVSMLFTKDSAVDRSLNDTSATFKRI